MHYYKCLIKVGKRLCNTLLQCNSQVFQHPDPTFRHIIYLMISLCYHGNRIYYRIRKCKHAYYLPIECIPGHVLLLCYIQGLIIYSLYTQKRKKSLQNCSQNYSKIDSNTRRRPTQMLIILQYYADDLAHCSTLIRKCIVMYKNTTYLSAILHIGMLSMY